ncbi:MAG: ABC transporter ATP-binding protein [Verrucomicrobiota bacterium]
MSIAVHCKAVKKTYGTGTSAVHALRGIDLEVKAGELMMLVGPSGCGKTTLISVIAGILDQSDGDCLVFDRDFKHMPAPEKTRYRGNNIGFVFQALNLIPTLSAQENVAVPLLIQNQPRRQAVQAARAVLDRVGFDERTKRALPTEISGGQQQRVAIARALIHNPRLIVCDEPTSALDHETGHKVMELLRSIALDGERSLIVVTHDARIFEFADRIARMDDGHITSITEGTK